MNTIEPGTSRDYTVSYIMWEAGIGAKKFLDNGFTFGLLAGVYYGDSRGLYWKTDIETNSFRTAPGMNGGYIKLTLGYGKVSSK